MSVFHNNALIGSGAGTGAAAAADYVIPKSLRFESDDGSYVRRIPSVDGNRRTWTLSAWVKRTELSTFGRFFCAGSTSISTGTVGVAFYQDRLFVETNGSNARITTDRLFRDPSAWYHIVLAVDTTQSTASDRVKIYVNGTQETSFNAAGYPSQNLETGANSTQGMTIGDGPGSQGNLPDSGFNGLLADVQLVDGQQLAPTEFGETRSSDGVWVPKEYTGFGKNPNNGTTWSTGASVGQGNFLVAGSSAFNGNLSDSAAPYDTAGGGGTNPSLTLDFSSFGGIAYTSSVRVYRSNGQANNHTISINGGTPVNHPWNQWFTVATGSGTLNSLTSVNNNSSNTTGIAAVEVDGYVLLDGARDNSFHLNFSDSSTIEALGFDSAPTIPDLDPKKGMDVVTYTGTGSLQNIGGLQFEPGLIWQKPRSNANPHQLYDSVRGDNARLKPSSTDAEYTYSAGAGLTFNVDGFAVGTDNGLNQSGQSFVAWCWRAGGPAVANTAGTITSQVSANTDYGFSICKITTPSSDGAYTFGHGLNAVPKLVIYRIYDQSMSWYIHHGSLNANQYLLLNNDSGTSNGGSVVFNNTYPTSSLISDYAGNASHHNEGRDMVYYCWSEVPGHSKISSYTGNGSATGPVVTTGFKPRFLLIKNLNSSRNWVLWDTERENNDTLKANSDAVEESNYQIDVLPDGFQIKNTWNDLNENGATIVYAAWADRPGNNWDVNNIVTSEALTTNKDNFDVVTWTGNGGTLNVGGRNYSSNVSFSPSQLNSSRGGDKAFNGLTSNNASAATANGSNVTITFSPSLTGVTSLEVYSASNSSFAYINGASGTTVSITANSYTNLNSLASGASNTISSLSVQTNGDNATIAAVKVNGTVLIDGTGIDLKFQPDLIWLKGRSYSISHLLYDSVRGYGADKELVPNGTNAEGAAGADSTYGYVSAVDSSGFTVEGGSDADNGYTNKTDATYVAWCWKAGGTAVSNTDGSITSSVSANVAHGFSIVSYTGTGSAATIGHGLNKKPSVFLIKNRDAAANWGFYYDFVDGSVDRLLLDDTSAKSDQSNPAATNSVFSSLGGSGDGASGEKYIAYCFANVPGYQRFGSYSGTGSSPGPVIVTGFKPRFLLVRRTSGTGGWVMLDSERNPANPRTKSFYAEVADAEYQPGQNWCNFLDNGFQPLATYNDINASGHTYLYWAIGDDEIGADEDCLVDVPNAVTADADATDTTGGYQRGNYATLNPLQSGFDLTNGNLSFAVGSRANWKVATATIHITSGKWYWEITNGTQNSAGANIAYGIRPTSYEGNTQELGYNDGGSKAYFSNGGTRNGDTSGTASYGASFGTGDVIGVALDADNGTLEFYKNGVSQGTAFTGLTGTWAPAVGLYTGGTEVGTDDFNINFGQMRFKYPMPSGYAALNTTALPAATIADGSAQFSTTLWDGNGSNGRAITLMDSWDLLWFKQRSSTQYHYLEDRVRGTGKMLYSNANNAEEGPDSTKVQSHTADGITVGTDGAVNASGQTYVAWTWNASANSNKTYTVTVVSDSGNKYRFDDHGTSAVTLDLAEGSTYIFDQSDSSNAGHPIRFGTSANGTDYTTGVTHTGTPGSAGAKTTLVLGTGVATLYYSCQNHSGMGGQINTNSTAGSTRLSGSENSVIYNQSQNYTNNVSSTSNITSGHEARLFNGILSGTNADIQSSQGTAGVINFSSAITGSKIEIYTIGNVGQIGINGSNLSVTANQFVDTGVTSLTSVETRHPGAGQIQNPSALRVDGKILVDSNVTPPASPSISSIVKASPEAGFSICKWTGNGSAGATVAHGLNAVPEWIVFKRTSATENWNTYHASMGASQLIAINSTNAASSTNDFNNTSPTSSVFTLGSGSGNNASGSTYIGYCFTSITGYSKFGSFEGGDPFVYLGFRPALIFCKSIDSNSRNWLVFDSTRSPDNPDKKYLAWDGNGAEGSYNACDFLSNGFKVKASSTQELGFSGETYIYGAWAVNPFSANGGLAI